MAPSHIIKAGVLQSAAAVACAWILSAKDSAGIETGELKALSEDDIQGYYLVFEVFATAESTFDGSPR